MLTREPAKMAFERLKTARLAREDAARDIEAEGLPDDGPENPVGFEVQYRLAFLVNNRELDLVEHGLWDVDADGEDEAVGIAYREIRDKYGEEDGYEPPSIKVHPDNRFRADNPDADTF